jgi:hypothetical protein
MLIAYIVYLLSSLLLLHRSLTKVTVLATANLAAKFKLDLMSGVFTVLDFHKMDLLLA